MAYSSHKHNHAMENEEITNMEETEEITRKGLGHDLPESRQSAGPNPATNVSCGCTGGGSWIFMVIVASVLVLYITVSVMS